MLQHEERQSATEVPAAVASWDGRAFPLSQASSAQNVIPTEKLANGLSAAKNIWDATLSR